MPRHGLYQLSRPYDDFGLVVYANPLRFCCQNCRYAGPGFGRETVPVSCASPRIVVDGRSVSLLTAEQARQQIEEAARACLGIAPDDSKCHCRTMKKKHEMTARTNDIGGNRDSLNCGLNRSRGGWCGGCSDVRAAFPWLFWAVAGQPSYGWWDFALRSVGPRHALPCPKGRRSTAGGHRIPVVSFGARTAPSARTGLGVGQKIGRANGRCRSSYWVATNATPSRGGAFFALGHDFCTENPASRTLFTTPANRCHRLFTFFLLAISTTYALGLLPTPHASLILVRGPETAIWER